MNPPAPARRRVEVADLTAGNGGVMVGRVDGRATFVRGALPGERVIAEVTDDRHAAYCHADAVEILDASPRRIAPMCPAAAAGAGCCDMSYTDPAHAREIKSTALIDLLSRVGGLPADSVTGLLVQPLGEATGWRTRVRMPVDPAGRPGQHRRGAGGVVVGARCAAPVPGLLNATDVHPWTPGGEVVAVRGDDSQIHLLDVAPAGPRRGGGRRARAQRSRSARATAATTLVAGAAEVCHRVGTRSWRLPPSAFWQAHHAAPQRYGEVVAELSARYAPAARVAWDLYGGTGVFAGALVDARPGLESVFVVETDAIAVAAARTTFADDHRVAAFRGPVSGAVGSLPAPDVVVADPPRSGAGDDVIGSICASGPRLVVHVGCDPATFARDLRSYSRAGYRAIEIHGFDAFPMTHHVEAIAALVNVD